MHEIWRNSPLKIVRNGLTPFEKLFSASSGDLDEDPLNSSDYDRILQVCHAFFPILQGSPFFYNDPPQ
jgi:hypothetical protein